jgi:hypothetical protein
MRKLLFFVLSAFSFANIKQFRDENRFQNENGAQKAKVNLKITLMNAKLLVQKESIIKLAYTKCSNEIIIINLSLVNKDGRNISYMEAQGGGGKENALLILLSLSYIDIYWISLIKAVDESV